MPAASHEVKKAAIKKLRKGEKKQRESGEKDEPMAKKPMQVEGSPSATTPPVSVPPPAKEGPTPVNPELKNLGEVAASATPADFMSILEKLLATTSQNATLTAQLEEERKKSVSREVVGTPTGTGMSEIGFLIEEKAPIEASTFPLRAKNLEGIILPSKWPRYAWWKSWLGAENIVAALIVMKELQEKYTLLEAVKNLKDQCRRNKRTLEMGHWRILQPILDGQPTSLEQDAWEICLIGDNTFGPKIADWMFTCRTVNPSLVRDTTQWVACVGGGLWPSLSTGGQNVGRIPPAFVPGRFAQAAPTKAPVKTIFQKAPVTTFIKKDGEK